MPSLEIADIAANLARLRERVTRAAERAGRRADEIALGGFQENALIPRAVDQ